MFHVWQVATTAGKACGVGNFAVNLMKGLRGAGAQVTTTTDFPEATDSFDLLLVHHEWDLFPDNEAFRGRCARVEKPLVLFAHSPETEMFADVVDGYISLAEGGVVLDPPNARPVFTRPHPAWIPAELEDRAELRREFDLPDGTVLGSSGFLVRDKRFPEILAELLPECAEHDWFVDLVTSRHYIAPPVVEVELDRLAQEYPKHFRYGTDFIGARELNRRLQACDILWCWSAEQSLPYGSGSISDQYASGTAVYGSGKRQHSHITRLPNATAGATELPAFVRGLIDEVHSGRFDRHDPASIGWPQFCAACLPFLRSVVHS